jgi:D-tyrosyl-tRNA(Tyr) deacylase
VLALLQRVANARVEVDGQTVGEIGPGLLVLVGVEVGDDESSADRMVEKILGMRVFDDAEGKMNEALGDRQAICVSQFTLCADTSKGTRPGFSTAAPPDTAEPLYERVRDGLGGVGGRFGSRMQVHLTNDEPVTIPLRT